MPVNKENKMTGYASIDKPWLKYYSIMAQLSRQKFDVFIMN